MSDYQQHLDTLFNQPMYAQPQAQKQQWLLPLFTQLHQHHVTHCSAYGNIAEANHWPAAYRRLEELPYLAVRLFKQLSLASIPPEAVFKTLQSSGTTGQTPARIVLDKTTSARQSKALVKIMQHWLGKARLPMLIIDSPAVLNNRQLFTARGAGIQGLAFLGRNHSYALDENMQPNWPVIEAFCQQYRQQPVMLFGFTFMLWRYFVQALQQSNKTISLPQGVLLHSGGWKKLESEKVSNQQFKQAVAEHCGISQVHNFYGMAEQVGSVFVECEQGHLHCPLLADVIVRNPYTLAPCSIGEAGLLQVLSVLPGSYPGHSLLTEDMGQLLGEDDCPCGRQGKYFVVHGRLPKTELRGCSDTHQVA